MTDDGKEWVIDISWPEAGWHASMEYITRHYYGLTWEESQSLGQDKKTMKPQRYEIALAMAQQAMNDLEDSLVETEYRLRNVRTGEVIPMALFQ